MGQQKDHLEGSGQCESYPWLHYDEANDSAFCHLCMRAVFEEKLLARTNVTLYLLAKDTRSYWKEVDFCPI